MEIKEQEANIENIVIIRAINLMLNKSFSSGMPLAVNCRENIHTSVIALIILALSLKSGGILFEISSVIPVKNTGRPPMRKPAANGISNKIAVTIPANNEKPPILWTRSLCIFCGPTFESLEYFKCHFLLVKMMKHVTKTDKNPYRYANRLLSVTSVIESFFFIYSFFWCNVR